MPCDKSGRFEGARRRRGTRTRVKGRLRTYRSGRVRESGLNKLILLAKSIGLRCSYVSRETWGLGSGRGSRAASSAAEGWRASGRGPRLAVSARRRIGPLPAGDDARLVDRGTGAVPLRIGEAPPPSLPGFPPPGGLGPRAWRGAGERVGRGRALQLGGSRQQCGSGPRNVTGGAPGASAGERTNEQSSARVTLVRGSRAHEAVTYGRRGSSESRHARPSLGRTVARTNEAAVHASGWVRLVTWLRWVVQRAGGALSRRDVPGTAESGAAGARSHSTAGVAIWERAVG
jgi:hypothetical protein